MIRIFKLFAATAAMTIVSVADARSPDLLSYIPEDSPYVFAMLEPMPDDVVEKFEPTTEKLLSSYRTVIQHAMDDGFGEASEEMTEEDREKAKALLGEVMSLLSLDGMRKAGLETNSLFALYGYGMIPVIRAELSDEALFDDTIARFEAKAESELKVAEASGETYKYAQFEEVRVLLATIDDQLVVTIAPVAFDEGQIAELLGIKKPRKNLKRAKTLANIEKKYGYTSHMTGYFDSVAIANAFLGERTNLDQALFDVFDVEEDSDMQVSDVCKREFVDLARIAPRMVFGYREISVDRIDSSFVIELRDDLAQGLATIPAAVPGLGVDAGGLMSFGFSLKPEALLNFVSERLDAIEENPYECEALEGLQAIVPQGRQMLAQPLPPVVYGFRGLMANITDIEGMDIANDQPPTSIDAAFVVAAENAQSLLMMGAMLDPQIAALNLLPDGNPVELPTPPEAAEFGPMFAALTESAISVAVGSDSEDQAAKALVAESGERAPAFSIAADAQRYYAFIGDAMAAAEAEVQAKAESGEEGAKVTPPEVQAAVTDMIMAASEIYERFVFDIFFTENGVEFDGYMTLVD